MLRRELQDAPLLVSEFEVSSVPTAIFFRGGQEEVRVNGAEPDALERLLEAATIYTADAHPSGIVEHNPNLALARAEELLREGLKNMERARELFQAVLERASSGTEMGDGNFAFRARVGLLRCAVLEGEAPHQGGTISRPIEDVTEELVELHASLLKSYHPHSWLHAPDPSELTQLLEHASLLIDLEQLDPDKHSETESKVLGIYISKEPTEDFKEENMTDERREELALREAFERVIGWYVTEVQKGTGLEDLVDVYSVFDRHVPVSFRDEAPEGSIYPADVVRADFGTLPPVIRAGSLLRRLMTVLGPTHSIVYEAQAKFAMALDSRKHRHFHRRRTRRIRGGPPVYGKGTGRRSGCSHRYGLFWGHNRMYRNSKPMSSPYSNTHNHSFS